MYWRAPFAALAIVAAIAVSPGKVAAQNVKRIGSGASFPFPIYSAWFKDFSKKNDGVTVDYQAKGSGAGIQDFTNRTVDFAGSNTTPSVTLAISSSVIAASLAAKSTV